MHTFQNSWNEAWKCSLDSTSIYEKDCSFFHSIADDSIMNGFNFADEREADLFFFNIQLAISQRGIKSTSSSRNAPQLPRRPPSNENNMPSVPPTRYEQPQTIKENSAQESRSSRVPPPMRPESSFESNPSTVISAMKSSSSEKRNEELESKKDNSIQGIFGFGKKKKEKKINKVLISNPSNFQ